MINCDSPLDAEDFGKFYTEYYSMLCMIAYEYTRNKMQAEEMVEDTFLALWEKRKSLQINTSIKNYLIKSTQNTCLQHIRKKKLMTQSFDEGFENKHISWGSDYPLGQLFEKELLSLIDKATGKLPLQCRKIFLLSRVEEMSYSQIAETLHISENTVKTQIKIALSRLRDALKDYLPIILIVMVKNLL
jgi:RNA polymerase sigma-70 factor (ECF subfamily)